MSAGRGLSFGAVAERYERFRPGYPDAAVDLLLAGAPASAVEIGAGTGKATRLVAGRGVPVTAVEPDPEMARVLLRETAGLPVTWVAATFEGLPPQEPVDLLYAAAAFHWTEPATRWQRAASLLRPGGVLACLGGPVDVADPGLAAEVERVRRAVLGDELSSGARGGDRGRQWPFEELAAAPGFADVREVDLTHVHPVAADDLVGLLSTVSSFVALPAPARDEVLARIRALLPDPVEVRRETTVHLARRV